MHDTRPPGVESAEAALRDRGFRLTAPRHAMLDVIRDIKAHPPAEEVNDRAHPHFTCLRCGRIADVEAPVAEPHPRTLSRRVEARTGLTIPHHRIDFFGRCRECQAAGAGSAEQTSSGGGCQCSRRSQKGKGRYA